MKLLIASSLYSPNFVGGAERIAQVLAEGLLKAGHEAVVATADGGRGTRVGFVNGVKVHYIGIRNLYWPRAGYHPPNALKPVWHAINSYNPWMASAFARVLDSEQPQVVNTHSLPGLSCSVWPVVKARELPLMHTLHDHGLLCPRTNMFVRDVNCSRPCAACGLLSAPGRRMSAHVDVVAGVSRYILRRHLDAGYFPNATARTVIYNGLPARPPAPARADRAAGPLRLGFVGRLASEKGVQLLVQQMAAWTDAECELVVAGAGDAEYERQLRAQAPSNVRFLGFVDPAELYRSIDVLVVPSLVNDSLPTTVIEAYLHGVPVIASTRGGLPELVDHGRTGLLFDPARPAAMAAAIGTFLADRTLAARMKPAVVERARPFSVERMRSDYLQLLTRAAAAGGQRALA